MAVNTYLSEVPPEINNPSPGAMLIVGRDPGYEEVREGRPLLGEDGRLLFSLLRSHGIHRDQVNITTTVRCKPYENDFSRHRAVLVRDHAKDLGALIDRLQPGVIVACGNEAAYTLVPEWPSKDHSVFRATGIKKRRGYWWSGKSPTAHKIVTTLNPSAALPFKDPSGINHMLLAHDLGVAAKEQLERGAKRLHRPYRKVHILLNWKQVEIAKNAILRAGVVAADIENYTKGDHHLRCIAIATSASESYVFPPSQFPAAFELLQDARVKTIWQNGQYDLQFLLQKERVKVAALHDDTIIQWHTLKPEVAGAAKDHLGRKRGSKQTAKGLAFLASIYSPFTPWWKDYNFATEREAWELCGRDTCLTYECWQAMRSELAEEGLEGIHAQTLTRVWPVVMILNRGMVVNEALRLKRLEQLREQRALQLKRITAVASPIIEANRERLAKPHLFFRRKVCSCCKNGNKQREACANCFGVSPNARKGELQAAARKHILAQKLEPHLTVRALEVMQKLTAADLKATYLKPCRECEGVGEWEELWFNPGSEQQVKDLLFNALKLPRAAKSDEATLKNLLAFVEEKGDAQS